MPTLVVQMGHAGRTTGSTGAPGEQELTNRLGQAAYARLHGRGGWQVRLIAADVPAGHYKGDAFVAFHADGNNNPNVDGASVGWQTSEGDRFSGDWQANYTALGWPGTWHDDNYTANLSGYYGVTNAVSQGNRRAFIAEVGTITNPADKTFITSEAGIAAAVDAVGIALGIINPQETDMTPEEHNILVGLNNAIGVTFAQQKGLHGEVVMRTEDKVAALAGAVADLAGQVAEIRTILTDLAGPGVTFVPTGEITIRAESDI